MNDNDIYELLGKSLDDKIKLDFDDVKERIANLPDEKTATVTPIAPFKKKKTAFAVGIAAAACLVCFIGLSVAFGSAGALSKSEAADTYSAYDYSYDSASEATAEWILESEECYDSVTADGILEEDSTLNSSFGSVSPTDILSDSDTQ